MKTLLALVATLLTFAAFASIVWFPMKIAPWSCWIGKPSQKISNDFANRQLKRSWTAVKNLDALAVCVSSRHFGTLQSSEVLDLPR